MDREHRGIDRRAFLRPMAAAGIFAVGGWKFAHAAPALGPRTINRQWILASRPEPNLTLANFRYQETPLGKIALKQGEILVRNEVFSLIPSQRMMMDDGDTAVYTRMSVGAPIRGLSVARVVQSAHPNLPIGARVSSMTAWEDYSVVAMGRASQASLPADMDSLDALGLYGINALTGYFGLLRIGQPKTGETVVVTAAAGSVGSMAAQIARIKGCNVIGIAGGKAKCDWLLKECKLQGAIDYKNEKVPERLRALAPKGVDVFFDNVGGTIMQDVIDQMAVNGRVVICGQISAYDSGKPAVGPRDMVPVILKRLRIEGFVTGDFLGERNAAVAELRKWKNEGQLVHKTDVRLGFKALPESYLDLFTGGNDGTLLVKSD